LIRSHVPQTNWLVKPVTAGQILKLKPDFLERSRWLIRRYVKFNGLLERIEAGLEKAGLHVKRA